MQQIKKDNELPSSPNCGNTYVGRSFVMYTEEQIEKAVFEARSLCLAKIVRHYDGFIIFAQNEKDFKSKMKNIKRGDIKGFYTVERVLSGRF